ncbi:MAG: serine hydrolase [Gordonia sp.]|nr:serine hydrolase [Gordonia sp. (in: high G+C Gram-positive bacteria)]
MHPSIRLIALALVTTCALAIGDSPAIAAPSSPQASGDTALAKELAELTGPDHPVVAAAVIDGDNVRVTTVGAELDDRFEIGSISKTVTGMLFAEAISRGEVQPETTASSLLPVLRGSPAERITLSDLATHRSGLPVQPPTADQYVRNQLAQLTGSFPYRESTANRLAQVRDYPLDSPPGTYSNVGYEVLGAALAKAAHTEFDDLARERILAPLGLQTADVLVDPTQLTAKDLRGKDTTGRTVEPWIGESMAPASGVRADITDMATYASKILSGTAPGMDALVPRADLGDSRIGWAWITTTTDDGREITWHDGQTSGFASYIGIDRHNGVATVLLTATGDSVVPLGEKLLAQTASDR